MESRASTLLDILSSLQFQIAILLALELDTCQVADLLESSEPTVCIFLCNSLDRTGCRTPEGLVARLLDECEKSLYDERFAEELARLQRAAKRMLERIPRHSFD
jgi:hypothetical protein